MKSLDMVTESIDSEVVGTGEETPDLMNAVVDLTGQITEAMGRLTAIIAVMQSDKTEVSEEIDTDIETETEEEK